MRAVLNGITADVAGGAIEYTWNESQVLELSARWYRFSDENVRYAIDVDFARKILDLQHFDLTLRPSFYTSPNTNTDVPYFSPSQDIAASVGLDAEQIIWRRYESSFGHRLMVSGGGYWQENYGAGWIGSILYEQVYRHDPGAEIRYGVQANRNLYDGASVPSLDFFVSVNFLF